jgi:hypothetical protein
MMINKLRGEFSPFIEFLQMIIISTFILVWFYISSLSGKRAVFFAECYKMCLLISLFNGFCVFNICGNGIAKFACKQREESLKIRKENDCLVVF